MFNTVKRYVLYACPKVRLAMFKDFRRQMNAVDTNVGVDLFEIKKRAGTAAQMNRANEAVAAHVGELEPWIVFIKEITIRHRRTNYKHKTSHTQANSSLNSRTGCHYVDKSSRNTDK